MDKEIEIQAAVFRRLLKHLDNRKDVQNIELMNLAGFCRNCFLAAPPLHRGLRSRRLPTRVFSCRGREPAGARAECKTGASRRAWAGRYGEHEIQD